MEYKNLFKCINSLNTLYCVVFDFINCFILIKSNQNCLCLFYLLNIYCTVKSDYKLTAARKHANYSTQTRTFLHAKTQFCPRKHANTQHRKHANPQTRKSANTQTRRRGIKGVVSIFIIILSQCLDYHLNFVKLWFIWKMMTVKMQKSWESCIPYRLLSKLMKTSF